MIKGGYYCNADINSSPDYQRNTDDDVCLDYIQSTGIDELRVI